MTRLASRASLLTAAVLASASALAGCSSEGSTGASGASDLHSSTSAAAGASSANPAPSVAPAVSTPPAVTASAGALTPAVTARLGRTVVPDSEMNGPGAARGRWKGTELGVLATGRDATLVVREGSAWRIVGGWWPDKGLPGPYLGARRHVLVLGSDARYTPDATRYAQRVERGRADTIQLVGLSGRGSGGILGLPRDSQVLLPGGRTGKINGAMTAAGPAGMTATVSRATGIGIEGYLLTDFLGFQRAVQVLRGIEVTLPRPVKDLPAGRQTLNGKQALALARERKSLPRGDFDRSANQGLLLMAGLTKLRAKGVLELPAVLTAIDPSVRTSLSPAQVLTFTAAAYALNPLRVGRQVAAGTPATVGGASVVRLTPQAQRQFAAFRDGDL